ncbi:MAG: NAD(+) synthase [Bacillota bacterium]|jgi:NAD+ synthase
MDTQSVARQLTDWLKQQVEAANCRGVVFGLSGGVDSAVVAALAQRAFGKEALGVIMPCHSDPQDAIDGELCARALHLEHMTVDLSDTFDQLCRTLGVSGDVSRLAVANLKPRLRMTTLYYYAALRRALVLGGSNRSELTIGYFTKHGDAGVDLMPLAGLVKHQVWELAAYLGVPQSIIDKRPSAGLWAGQYDEQEMGITYRQLDEYILTGNATKEVRSAVDRLHFGSEHKRRMPLKPDISMQ